MTLFLDFARCSWAVSLRRIFFDLASPPVARCLTCRDPAAGRRDCRCRSPGTSRKIDSNLFGALQQKLLRCTKKGRYLKILWFWNFAASRGGVYGLDFGLAASTTILAALWPRSWTWVDSACIWRLRYSRLQAHHLRRVLGAQQLLRKIERRRHILLGIGHRFMRDLRGAAMCGLGVALHLSHRLVGRLDKAVDGLPGLRHALLGEGPHLGRNCKLLKWIFGHVTLPVLPAPRS